MKLLITTQTVDINDPILGFFVRWISELAPHFEHMHVICLREGAHQLPSNVSVYSLGKEKRASRFLYILKFFKIVHSLRGEYDAVFSHMNPHYIVLAGWYWKLKRVHIFFWRNHAKMNLLTRIAAFFSKKVFYTSPFACTARYKHAVQMPVGIDTDFFAPEESGHSHTSPEVTLLSLGRLSPVKRVETMIASLSCLPDTYTLHVYGDAPQHDASYGEMLTAMANDRVTFHGSVKNTESPTIFNTHDIFINLTPNGSMDKTVLEAAACGCPVIYANESFIGVLPNALHIAEASPEALAKKIEEVTSMLFEERVMLLEEGRAEVDKKHSLKKLVQELVKYIHHD